MARIKINDLPKDMKISKEEMKKVVGGLGFVKITGTVDAEMPEFHFDSGDSRNKDKQNAFSFLSLVEKL